MIERFHLQRDEDESGVSGTGIVAVGVRFPSGRCVIEWTDTTQKGVQSIGIYQSIAEVEIIHGHGGKTRVEWEPDIIVAATAEEAFALA